MKIIAIMFLSLIALALMIISGCTTTSENSHVVLSPSHDPAKLKFNLVTPAGNGQFPAVILMHGCGGLDEHPLLALKSHSKFLVGNGFATVILDSFSPRNINKGSASFCSDHHKLANARNFRTIDAFAVKDYLEGLLQIDKNNIFIMGQSNGGSVALLVAQEENLFERKNLIPTPFRAVAAFYPWCESLRSSKLVSPLIILGGAEDNWTPIKPCISKSKTVKNTDIEVIAFPDAHHSFDLNIKLQTYAGKSVGGNSKAKKEAQNKMVAFFRKHMQ